MNLFIFSVAGSRLLDLVSRDGDWFLEELVSMTGNVMQFATFARTYWMVRMYIITCLCGHLYYHPIGSKQVDLTEKNIINNLSRKFKRDECLVNVYKDLS